MARALILLGCAYFTLAANIGVDVDKDPNKVSASLYLDDSEEICNSKKTDETGCCVDAGTCGVTPLKNGKNVGKCKSLDGMKQQKDCCMMTVPCGEVTHSYVSYFTNPSWPHEEKDDCTCSIKVEVKPKVCQVRLDFLEFNLPAPDLKTGICLNNNNMVVFTHSNPVGLLGERNHGFCGDNNKQHLYIHVEPKDKINIMTTITEINKKKDDYEKKQYKWNIKITQIECGSDDKFFCDLEAPMKACRQYFTEQYGVLKSFNYDEHARLGINQEYKICIRNKGNHGAKACSITFRAKNFMMPVGGNDVGFCESGVDIVNENNDRECCVDPKSSYLAFVGQQPPISKHSSGDDGGDGGATRRYWCGKKLGPVDEVTDLDLAALAVFSGAKDDSKLDYVGNGFCIDYKIETGYC